ncbi:MAG: SGNH/GDSL hydrolase family protein [Geminicoccaceae bacterium]
MRQVMVCLFLILLGGLLSVPMAAASPCDAPPTVWGGFVTPPRVVSALARGAGVRVIAFGSSSTEGAGASAPEHTYPAQLQSLLRERFPGRDMRVLNRGVGGENVADNLARLDRAVLRTPADLVIWQVGTNDALQDRDAETVASEVEAGIAAVRATGADIVLMDSQPLPDTAAERSIERIWAAVDQTALKTGTAVLPRHALMRYWLEIGAFTFETMLGPDHLHMTDAAYHCLAVRIADLFPEKGPALVSQNHTGS